MAPPSTITNPPRDFSPRGAPTTYFWDPDIIAVDPSFNDLAQPNTRDQAPLHRAVVGRRPGLERAGPLPPVERHSQQPADAMVGGRRSRQRVPHAVQQLNGNSFDFQGRQLSCEHLTRRVVRYEHDGTATVLADNFDGKKLNSPNDVVAHPDGSYWFTDPPYGGQLYEGEPDVAGGPSNSGGKLNPRIGPAGRLRAGQARTADQLLSHRSRPAASTSW